MKLKKLVIFFLGLLTIYLIYNFTYKEKYVYLSLGDELASGRTPFDTYNSSYADYVYDYLKEKTPEMQIKKANTKEDLRIKDLLKELKNPEDTSEPLSKLIKEADIITISIGSEELFSKIRSNKNLITTNTQALYKFIDELYISIDEVLTEMRYLTKKPIYMIGYYNIMDYTAENETKIDSIFNYIDIKLQSLEKKHKINYVKIYEGFKEKQYYLPNKDNAFPSLEGYNYIANQIIEKIKES